MIIHTLFDQWNVLDGIIGELFVERVKEKQIFLLVEDILLWHFKY